MGLNPHDQSLQKKEVGSILQSLRYIQKFEPSVEEGTLLLRQRQYQDYIKDPFGKNLSKLKELNLI